MLKDGLVQFNDLCAPFSIDFTLKQLYAKEQSYNRLLWNRLQKFNLLILGRRTPILGTEFKFDYTVQELVKFEKGVGIERRLNREENHLGNVLITTMSFLKNQSALFSIDGS